MLYRYAIEKLYDSQQKVTCALPHQNQGDLTAVLTSRLRCYIRHMFFGEIKLLWL